MAAKTEKGLKQEIVNLFPVRLRQILEALPLDFARLEEIRMRCGQPILFRIAGKEMGITGSGDLTELGSSGKLDNWEKLEKIREKELKDTLEIMGGFSLYAAEEELRQGFFTVRGGHRIGVAGRVILKDRQITGLKAASFLNVRVAHEIKGCADQVLPFLYVNGKFVSTLIVSPPGCGKTTLIKCLTGIYEQDQGQILVCGEEIFENPNVKAQVGYVADSNQYFEGYHIDEMVEFYKQIYPTFDEKVFRDYNQSIGLDVSKRIKELSKGQAMSLASMLNLSIHPKVMIMDEPMSGLDVIAQKQIKDFIVNEVDMNGMSVLISSHDLKDLESFCDSASMMKDGKILYHGTMDQMKERFTKLQVVFEESRSEIFKELPGVITYSNLGSVYTVILEGYGEPIHEALKQAGAIVVEEIPLSLEEVFVYSNR